MRPSALRSPRPDTPSASAETMSGSTSTNRRRRKIFPAGSVTSFTNCWSAGASPQAMCAATPRSTPSASPASIRYDWSSFMARQYRGSVRGRAIAIPGRPTWDYAGGGMERLSDHSLLPRAASPRRILCTWTLVVLLAVRAHAQTVPDGFAVETLAPGLSAPVAFDFLSDGRVLFAEQLTARVRVFKQGSGVQTTPVLSVAGVAAGGERGLLGLAVDPSFPLRPYLYLYYDVAVPNHIRIARYTLSGNLDGTSVADLVADPASRFDLIDDIPDQAENHNGGTLRFGLERLLYASVGEDGVPCGAQDSTSLRGVILRLNTSELPPGPGRASRAQLAPADNPFAASPDSNERLVAALGLRNPFRFQVDFATGQLVIGDVGENVREEIDLLSTLATTGVRALAAGPGGPPLGAGFGWPPFGGAAAPPAQRGGAAIISAGAMHAVPGRELGWPASYSGDLFASDYYSGDLRRLQFANGAWGIAPPVPGQPSAGSWGTGVNEISDWRLGQDGALWFCRQSVNFGANSGSIGRISGPGGPAAGAPVLTIKNTPAAGSARIGVTATGPVRLRILDLAGRAVRTLIDHADPGSLPGTEATIVWDGRADDGAAVRAGMYVALLEAGGRRVSRLIPFLR